MLKQLRSFCVVMVTAALLACSSSIIVRSDAPVVTQAPVVIPQNPSYIIKVANKAQLEQERNCLALNIYHEARGESREGQIAVAQVTINRVRDSEFPDTICQVVYQKYSGVCQFSWVCVKKSQYPGAREEYAQIKKLADSILAGKVKHTKLESTNAVYYHADWVSPEWMDKKKRITKIGTHVFYAEGKRVYST